MLVKCSSLSLAENSTFFICTQISGLKFLLCSVLCSCYSLSSQFLRNENSCLPTQIIELVLLLHENFLFWVCWMISELIYKKMVWIISGFENSSILCYFLPASGIWTFPGYSTFMSLKWAPNLFLTHFGIFCFALVHLIFSKLAISQHT